jgi:hypothetical protein
MTVLTVLYHITLLNAYWVLLIDSHLRHTTNCPYQLPFSHMYLTANFAPSTAVRIQTISNNCCYVCHKSTAVASILVQFIFCCCKVYLLLLI